MRVHHIAMRTRDVDRLEGFYVGVLGFKVVRRDAPRGSVWLDAASAVLMLERADPGEPEVDRGSKDLVAFAVEAKDPWRERLADHGVTIESETPHTLYFRDPDGRRIGVSAYPLAP